MGCPSGSPAHAWKPKKATVTPFGDCYHRGPERGYTLKAVPKDCNQTLKLVLPTKHCSLINSYPLLEIQSPLAFYSDDGVGHSNIPVFHLYFWARNECLVQPIRSYPSCEIGVFPQGE